MRSPKFYFFSGVITSFVIIALIIITAIMAFRGFSSSDDYKVDNSVSSPDGKHIATVYYGMGGGAAGWCSSYVSVDTNDPKHLIENDKHEYDNVVFDGSCSTKPKIEWTANSKLLVKYSGPKDRGGVRIFKRASSNDGFVQIMFIEQ